MNIKVWTDFSKRENSTKQPASGTTLDVHLKGPCSLHNPIFVLSNPIGKYTYVEAFGEYYFVDDVINLNDSMCEVHCRKDPMATYKTGIGNTTAFVLYDGSTNTNIQDTRLANVYAPTIASNRAQLHANLSRSGSIVATVTGQDATYCYMISTTDIYKLMPNIKSQVESIFATDHTPTGILDDDFVPTIISAVRQILASGDLATNIRDVRWIPFSYAGSGAFRVYVGMYQTDIVTGRVQMTGTNRIDARGINVNIPWQFSDWRRSYCTDINVHIPFVGDVSFPASALASDSGITFNVSADMISGDISVELRGTQTGLYIGSYGGSTGVTIPLGNASPSLSRIANTLISGTSRVLSSTSMTGAGASAISAIGAGVSAIFTPLTQTVGGIGSSSAIGLTLDAVVSTISHGTTVTPSSVSASIGTPTFAQKQISTCPSGYIQCQNASVDIPADVSDREIINSYLNTGFFYE